jgi:DNA-binding NarL/FixJ family response regulator
MSISEKRTKTAQAIELGRESQRLTALQMKHDGYSNSTIARQMGIAESAVRRLLEPKPKS